jgi:F-type H+-transporting ATPase subunit beta
MAAPASTLEQKTAGATGKIVQITGVVVDIEFPSGQLPEIYNAVETNLPNGTRLVLEV